MMEAEGSGLDTDGYRDNRREEELRGISQKLRLIVAVAVLVCAAVAAIGIIAHMSYASRRADAPQRELRFEPYPWPRSARNFSITFSLLAVPSEANTVASAVTALISSFDYECDVRQVVVDNDPARNNDLSAIVSVLEQLVLDGTLTTYAFVDYSRQYTFGGKSVYHRIFGRQEGPQHDLRGKGYLSYLFEIDTCKTDYLLHFDSDIRVYTSHQRSPVLDLVSLLRAFPGILATALPTSAGTDSCEFDPNETLAHHTGTPGVQYDERGFVNVHFLSTQGYLMDVHRLRNYLPIPLENLSVEWSLSKWGNTNGTIVGAMLPYYRPPFYFRSHGKGKGTRFEDESIAAPNMAPCMPKGYSNVSEVAVYVGEDGAVHNSEILEALNDAASG
jgi:hypothetical protein